MKKLILLFSIGLAFASCTKEEPLTPQPITADEVQVQMQGFKLIFDFAGTQRAMLIAAAPATNLHNSFSLDGNWFNYIWTVNGGEGIAFKVEGLPVNPMWYAGASWTGISFDKTIEPQYVNCGGTTKWTITTYDTFWYVGQDSSLIPKHYAWTTVTVNCPLGPTQLILPRGHRH